VPCMGMGCMPISEYFGPQDQDEGIRTIQQAIDIGLNFLDTSDMYGPYTNEELVGRAIRGRRAQVVLATKFGIVRDVNNRMIRGISGRPDYVRQACDASLRRLGTDVIDLFYLHRVDPKVPIEESVGALASLVRDGKVRHIGLSEAAPATIRRAHKVHPITALQSEYSLWYREPEQGVLPVCRELGIAFVPFSPLGRGFLSGAVKDPGSLASDDVRRRLQRRAGVAAPRRAGAAGERGRRELRRLARGVQPERDVAEPRPVRAVRGAGGERARRRGRDHAGSRRRARQRRGAIERREVK